MKVTACKIFGATPRSFLPFPYACQPSPVALKPPLLRLPTSSFDKVLDGIFVFELGMTFTNLGKPISSTMHADAHDILPQWVFLSCGRSFSLSHFFQFFLVTPMLNLCVPT
jgi:hypothetical protein